MAKPDWAELKVEQGQRRWPYTNMLELSAKLLRAERRRAVRVVGKVKPYAHTIYDEPLLKRADILAALKGGK